MKILKENKNTTKDLVSEWVMDRVEDCFDNLAIFLHAEIPAYNPDWCADDMGVHTTSTEAAMNQLAHAVVEELFANYKGE